MFDMGMSDTVSSWYLNADGTWTRHQTDAKGGALIDLQDYLMQQIHSKRHNRN
jgi:polyphosphate kinase